MKIILMKLKDYQQKITLIVFANYCVITHYWIWFEIILG